MQSKDFPLKRSLTLLLIPFLLTIFIAKLSGQEIEDPIRCGMDHWLEIQMQDPDFAKNLRENKGRYLINGNKRNPDCSNPLVLPIAIHWNGNVENTPCLLDMTLNQIEVLNQDFGGYNADIENYCENSLNCPDEYPTDAVTSGTCIQFCLATMNHPAGSGLSDGEPAFTFGQYTFNTGAPGWSGYVNIFVSDIPPPPYGSNLLGVAPLFGGANPNGNGVFVRAQAFGGFEEECDAGGVTINSYNNYDLGRTATHELGHYYGLYHTFEGCFFGDGIDDTPAQSQSNSGIPSVGPDCISNAHNTCGTQDFFFNYMDYCYDAATYMFTSDQSDVIYDVALDGIYQTDVTVCNDIPNDYFPTFPDGCFTCPELSVEASVQDNFCYGDCEGNISVDDVIDGTGPFDYNWSNGGQTATIDQLCSGSYTVTITDQNGCEVVQSFFVDEPSELFSNASSTDETGNDFEDGTATANPTGGVAPYFYSWSNGETTQNIDHLAPGNYTVTVSDFNGCFKIQSVDVAEFICPVLSVDSDKFDIFCAGECTGSVSINEVAGSEPPLIYDWNNGETTAFIGDLCEGAYVVTINDFYNCSITPDTFHIVEPLELLISTLSTDETGMDLNDGTATVTPSGGIEPYTYLWSNGETTQTITGLAPGTYTVTVTDANDCDKEDLAIVEEYDCPNLSLETISEDLSCFETCDGFIEVIDMENGEPPFIYEWSNGTTESVAENLCAGTYEVTVTDATECAQTQSFELFQPDQLEAITESTDETAYQANDGTASVSQNGGNFPYDYLWSTSETSQSITGLAPGTYSVTVTDAHGCSSVSEVIVEEFVCPDLAIQSEQTDLLCFGECTGQLAITDITNGTAPFNYSWSNGSTTGQLDNLCAGEYSVTVTDDFNCPVISDFELSQPDALQSVLTTTDETAFMAEDGTIASNTNGGTPPYEYNWSNGAQTGTIDMLSPGTYYLTLTDANGCEFYEEAIVNPFICPDITTDANILHNPCFSDCEGSIEILEVVNGEAPYVYSWENGSTGEKIEGLCAGTYQVTITDDKNCTIEREYTVLEPDEIIITVDQVTDVTVNTPGSIEISTNLVYDYSWTSDNGFQSKEEDIFGLEKGCYTLVVTDLETDCTQDTTICVDDLTAVKSIWNEEINLYPNPADDKLYIEFGSLNKASLEVQLVNWTGIVVRKYQKDAKSDRLIISTKDLPEGMYLIRVQNNDIQLNRKMAIFR